MLILSLNLPKRSEPNAPTAGAVYLTFPDGQIGKIQIFERIGGRVRVGFDLPDSVGVSRSELIHGQVVQCERTAESVLLRKP